MMWCLIRSKERFYRVLDIPTVTLLAIDGVGNKTNEYTDIIQDQCNMMEFGSVVFLTADSNFDGDGEIDVRHIAKMNYHQFNEFLCVGLSEYVNTEHVLYIQEDGFVVDSNKWREDFLEYDYIGSPWIREGKLIDFCGGDVENVVGCGGFSIRSKKFLELASMTGYSSGIASQGLNEDVFLCNKRFAGGFMRDNGIKFAPLEVANKFASEEEIVCNNTFGFHGTSLAGKGVMK
jgi:hypothetical protein